MFYLTSSMVHSPSWKQGSKRPRHRGEDTGDASQQHKRQKATTQLPNGPSLNLADQPHCSNRTGAGTGGHISQLERVGAVVEGSQRVPRPRTTLPDGIAQNPVAPRPHDKSRKKVTGRICPSKTFTSRFP